MWIDLEGLANLRDVGGIPMTDGGQIAAGRLLRSDNLQALTPADIDRLLEIGLTDVVDLRSEYEVESEGPGRERVLPSRSPWRVSQEVPYRPGGPTSCGGS